MTTHGAQEGIPRSALGAEGQLARYPGGGDWARDTQPSVLTLSPTPPSHHFHFIQQSCPAWQVPQVLLMHETSQSPPISAPSPAMAMYCSSPALSRGEVLSCLQNVLLPAWPVPPPSAPRILLEPLGRCLGHGQRATMPALWPSAAIPACVAQEVRPAGEMLQTLVGKGFWSL